MNTRRQQQQSAGLGAEELVQQLVSLQRQLEEDGPRQPIVQRLEQVTQQLQQLLDQVAPQLPDDRASGTSLDQLRSEIDTERTLLAEVRTLRGQIEGDWNTSEELAGVLSHEVTSAQLVIEARPDALRLLSEPASQTSEDVPLIVQTDDPLVGEIATRSRRRRTAPSLPSVRSLKGSQPVRRDLSQRKYKVKRAVSIRSITEKRTIPILEPKSEPVAPPAPAIPIAAPKKREPLKVEAPKLEQAKPEPKPVHKPEPAPAIVEPQPTVELLAAPLQSAELQLPARWWNVGLLLLAFIPGAAAYSWLSVANMTTAWTLTDLQDALTSANAERRTIEYAVDEPTSSPLARFDGRRDYLVAQAFYRLDPLTTDPVKKNLERAISREPANVWNRLTLAMLEQSEVGDMGEPAEQWDHVRRLSNAEPAYWGPLAKHWCDSHEPEKAVAAYRKLLIHRPESTEAALRNLSASSIDIEESLRAVPASAIASLQAALFLREQRVADWRERTELLLTKIAKDMSKRSADDLAAEAELCQLLDRTEESMALLSEALLRRPDRHEWRLRLARLHYGSEQFAECDKLALQVIRTAPGTDLADQARLLREKIELVTGGGPIQAN